MMARRTVPGTGRPVTGLVFDPDRWSIQAASLGLATATFSPMSVGVHSPGASARGFVGDRGYGVNRMAGRTNPVQFFAGAAAATAPVADPRSRRLGIGAGPSGQPGLPSTGTDDNPLGALGMAQLRLGWGG